MTEKADRRFCFSLESLDAVGADEGGVDRPVGVRPAFQQQVVQVRARHGPEKEQKKCYKIIIKSYHLMDMALKKEHK